MSRWRGVAAGFFLFAAGSFAATDTHADAVVGWDLSDQPLESVPSLAPTSVAEGVSAIDLTRGPGIQESNLTSGFSSIGWDRDTPDRDTALSNGDYFEFGFTVEEGQRAFLSALDISLRRSALNAPMNYEWQYSFDEFETEGVTIVPKGEIWDSFDWAEDHFTYLGRAPVNENYLSDEPYRYMTSRVDGLEGAPMPPIDLSDVAALQDIPENTTVTFRLYAWGNDSTASTNTVALGRDDGPVLTGAVTPVDQIPLTIVSSHEGTDPEPGVYEYNPGTEVTVTAPDEVSGDDTAHRLIGYSGTGSAPAEGEENSVTFTLDEATTLEWHWQQISGQPEPVIDFDLTGTSGDTRDATSVPSGITPDVLRLGPGIDPAGLLNGFSSNGWARTDPTRETALSNGDYFEFSFIVDDGYRASLSALEVSLRRSALNAPMYYEWQYSFDDFDTDGVTVVPTGPVWDMFGWTDTFFTYFGRAPTNTNYLSDEPYRYMTDRVDGLQSAPMPPIILNEVAELQNIPAGTEVTFRLYAWGNDATTNTNTVALGRVDGPKLSGAVAPDDLTPLTVNSSQSGTDPFPGVHFLPEGGEVTATAPTEVDGGEGIRHSLAGWTGVGSVPASSGGGSSVTFNLDSPTTLEWDWDMEHRLQVAAQGDGVVDVRTVERTPVLGFDFANYRYDEDGEYDAGEISNEDGVPSSFSVADVDSSTITRGPGINPADLGLGGISSDNWNGTPSFDDAISGNKYLEFNVTPAGGASIELNSIYIPYRYTQTGPHSIALLYSFDGFSSYSVAESVRIQDQNSGTNLDSYLFTLPNDPELQNLTSEVTFRIYGWGGTGTGVGTFAPYNENGANIEDMIVYGGTSTETTVSESDSFWLSPDSLVDLEALPGSTSIFTGWSGTFAGSAPLLFGVSMVEPVSVQGNFETSSDGDGIPDWWKELYFPGETVAAGDDPDGDDFTNLEEYLRGTDPTVAEERVASDGLSLSFWENVQRDLDLPGQFIVRDFGDGYRGVWEGSNDNRNALTPFRPDGEPVSAVNGVSFDTPRMIVREEVWDESWSDAAVSAVLSVGDDDGNSVYFRYQDELNWFRVTVSGEEHAPGGPVFGISVSKRVDGEYYDMGSDNFMATDPTDESYYKRVKVTITPDGPSDFLVELAGWDPSAGEWAGSGDFGYVSLDITDSDEDLTTGRAGFGAWAQGGNDHEVPEWNPVDGGVLFERFTVTLDDEIVFEDDWSSAPLADELPAGWENPYEEDEDLGGNWRNSAHATLVQMSGDGGATSGTDTSPRADADGPILLGPVADVSSYALELGLHPFGAGAVGFVFDYEDTDNYGRVLFSRTFGDMTGSIPSGVVVSRKTDGVWSDLLMDDQTFVRTQGKPFLVSFSRAGSDYTMNVREADHAEPVHRWQWSDANAAPEGNGYGFTSWQSTDAHFLYADVYGVAVATVEGLEVTAIEKIGDTIHLTVENDSGEPYDVQRTLDLSDGAWDTVDTDQTGETWEGDIPAGAERAFWRLTR